jgi:hypothetical protein
MSAKGFSGVGLADDFDSGSAVCRAAKNISFLAPISIPRPREGRADVHVPGVHRACKFELWLNEENTNRHSLRPGCRQAGALEQAEEQGQF